MGWTIKFTPKADKLFSKLDRSNQKRIIAKLEEVSILENPRSTGKALTGNLAGLWRYRAGDYRIICSIEDTEKGVDMRIGLDIASLSYKKIVDQIILIAGDSDFVPAAKLARREGIDFILDSLYLNIKDDHFEHIDGRRTMVRKPDEKGNFDGVIIWPKNKPRNGEKRKLKKSSK